MNRGHAEQIGAPTEIYERPATVFVAGFIGSPAMNLLSGRLSEDGRTFEVAGGGPTLVVGGAPGVGSAIGGGREWILGIRPEHMPPCADVPAASFLVDSCELLGADNLAHGRWGDHDVTVRLPHGHRPSAGATLWAALPPEHLHFFDPATGKRAG
jgi:sn-glycerol 3-phosphate transport system ATP-binding protein